MTRRLNAVVASGTISRVVARKNLGAFLQNLLSFRHQMGVASHGRPPPMSSQTNLDWSEGHQTISLQTFRVRDEAAKRATSAFS